MIIGIIKRFLYPFFFLLAIFSCESRVSVELSRAENLFQQHPDSALSCLRRIEQKQLRTNEERARYALWLSAALDKNYIDVASDSLIRIAVDYYSKHGDVRYKTLAWYYEGIVLKNAAQYPRAIIALEKAEKEALLIDDFIILDLYVVIRPLFSVSPVTEKKLSVAIKRLSHTLNKQKQ